MDVVTGADAAAIREVYEREGELSAAIELRRRFPGVTDSTQGQGAGESHCEAGCRFRTVRHPSGGGAKGSAAQQWMPS